MNTTASTPTQRTIACDANTTGSLKIVAHISLDDSVRADPRWSRLWARLLAPIPNDGEKGASDADQ